MPKLSWSSTQRTTGYWSHRLHCRQVRCLGRVLDLWLWDSAAIPLARCNPGVYHCGVQCPGASSISLNKINVLINFVGVTAEYEINIECLFIDFVVMVRIGCWDTAEACWTNLPSWNSREKLSYLENCACPVRNGIVWKLLYKDKHDYVFLY